MIPPFPQDVKASVIAGVSSVASLPADVGVHVARREIDCGWRGVARTFERLAKAMANGNNLNIMKFNLEREIMSDDKKTNDGRDNRELSKHFSRAWMILGGMVPVYRGDLDDLRFDWEILGPRIGKRIDPKKNLGTPNLALMSKNGVLSSCGIAMRQKRR